MIVEGILTLRQIKKFKDRMKFHNSGCCFLADSFCCDHPLRFDESFGVISICFWKQPAQNLWCINFEFNFDHLWRIWLEKFIY